MSPLFGQLVILYSKTTRRFYFCLLSELQKIPLSFIKYAVIPHTKMSDIRYTFFSSWSLRLTKAVLQNFHFIVLCFSNSNEVALFCFFIRFGAKYRSTETGIIYNNEMADFDIPGHEIVDSITPSPFNFPEPGKRPFSSMCPTILTDNDGKVRLVIGASGGKRITTAVSLVRLILFFYATWILGFD